MIQTIYSVAYILLGVVLTEAVSYFMHRYLFHGILWPIHKSHHIVKSKLWQTNDVFSLFFTVVAIVLIRVGVVYENRCLEIGLGITVYGVLYFILHDIYTHQRFARLETHTKWTRAVRSAHRKHHTSITKHGCEPYGFLWF